MKGYIFMHPYLTEYIMLWNFLAYRTNFRCFDGAKKSVCLYLLVGKKRKRDISDSDNE